MSLNGKERLKTRIKNGIWLDAPTVDCSKDKTLTVQADRDSADINRIVDKFEKGQTLTRINSRPPFYGDVSKFSGLADALMKVQETEELFMVFDAKTREKFDNDPVKFIEFLENPANRDEAIEMGIIKAPQKEPTPAPGPAPTPPVPDPAG